MCLSPRLQRNPYYGYSSRGDFHRGEGNSRYVRLHDTRSQYIYVPCHTCAECLHSRQSHFAQFSSLLSPHSYQYFITLTYQNKALPFVKICDEIFYFPDYQDVKLLFKRIRKIFHYDFRYLVCSEFGSHTHRPHFHILLSVIPPNPLSSVEALNIESWLRENILSNWKTLIGGSKRSPLFLQNTVYREKYSNGKLYRNYDCHYIDPSLSKEGNNDVAYYVTKYTTKYDSYVYDLKRRLYAVCDSISPDSPIRDVAHLRDYVSFSKNSQFYQKIFDKYSSYDLFSVLWRYVAPKVVTSKDYLLQKSMPSIYLSIESVVKNYISISIFNSSEHPQFFSRYSGKSSKMDYELFRRFATLEQFEYFCHLNAFDDVDSLTISEDDYTSSSLNRVYKYANIDKIMSLRYGDDVFLNVFL